MKPEEEYESFFPTQPKENADRRASEGKKAEAARKQKTLLKVGYIRNIFSPVQ